MGPYAGLCEQHKTESAHAKLWAARRNGAEEIETEPPAREHDHEPLPPRDDEELVIGPTPFVTVVAMESELEPVAAIASLDEGAGQAEAENDPPLSLDATLEGSPLVAAAKAIEEAKRELRWAERQLNTALADLQELLREFAA
jgi:hypothetical protein